MENHFVIDGAKVLVPEGKLKILRELSYSGKDIVIGIRPQDIHDEPLFLKHPPDTRIKAAKIQYKSPFL